MIAIRAEQEHYCLVTDGKDWTVVERRAGKYYPLGDCTLPGMDLSAAGTDILFQAGRRFPEPVARRILARVADEWRGLAEHIR